MKDYENKETQTSDITSDAQSTNVHALFQPNRITSRLLQHVVYGKQNQAEELLTNLLSDEQKKQEALLQRELVTDYSGRTFKRISAYEYAYWVKDRHMCCMLEHHMDANTKTEMFKRCEEIDANWLTYTQHGIEITGSKHFDLTPLKTALEHCIDAYMSRDKEAMKLCWEQLCIVQRDLPVHIVNEYCRTDRPFRPLPEFNEANLPREISYMYEVFHSVKVEWLSLDEKSKHYGLVRGVAKEYCDFGPRPFQDLSLRIDLAAITKLDEVRTAELVQLRARLNPLLRTEVPRDDRTEYGI